MFITQNAAQRRLHPPHGEGELLCCPQQPPPPKRAAAATWAKRPPSFPSSAGSAKRPPDLRNRTGLVHHPPDRDLAETAGIVQSADTECSCTGYLCEVRPPRGRSIAIILREKPKWFTPSRRNPRRVPGPSGRRWSPCWLRSAVRKSDSPLKSASCDTPPEARHPP